MTQPKRLIPHWPFPKYIFIPGKNPHPKKEGGHMEGEKDPVAPAIERDHPEKNDFFKYGIDLLNHGYFWESHVYFESLWNTHERQGSTADFLKAMIKFGAAGVKISIEQPKLAEEHYLRGEELLQEVISREGEVFLGFNLKEILDQIHTHRSLCLAPSWG